VRTNFQRQEKLPIVSNIRRSILLAGAVCSSSLTHAQQRSQENAVTQAEDGFGFSVGRETLGIYNAGNARGFSPASAGNLRIDGLYYDQVFDLPDTLVQSTSIRVGVSAQGYAFAAPSGIVDYSLRRPSDKAGVSFIANFDSYGTVGLELSGSAPIGRTASIGYGFIPAHQEFKDGTNNFNHTESLSLRWQPVRGVEILPFFAINNDYHDESGTLYVPSGSFLPVLPKPRRMEGASWADFRYTATNYGLLASARISQDWTFRLGAFHSANDVKRGFSNLFINEGPDGAGERVLYADPRHEAASVSGEARLSRTISEGPRLHLIHISARRRDAKREFGGSEFIDFGPGRIGEKVHAVEPEQFNFGELSRDHVTQTTIGIAYDGRWRNVGELSFGLSHADFRKVTSIPGAPPAITKARPWLYNATAAINFVRSLTVYAGYARGLEESGTAPPNAANRGEPLPAIVTEQKDAGFRLGLPGDLKAVLGIFDLSRPYFGFDPAKLFKQVGTVESRGVEFSLSGNPTRRLSLVAGGVLLRPRVTASDATNDTVGSKPVGLPDCILNLNLNWKTPLSDRFDLDLAANRFGRAAATTDNLVFAPARTTLDFGAHYRFQLAGHAATFRLQLRNVLDDRGYAVVNSGIYGTNEGRSAQGYLTFDL
jgi:iron complex outermembrane receptor protein